MIQNNPFKNNNPFAQQRPEDRDARYDRDVPPEREEPAEEHTDEATVRNPQQVNSSPHTAPSTSHSTSHSTAAEDDDDEAAALRKKINPRWEKKKEGEERPLNSPEFQHGVALIEQERKRRLEAGYKGIKAARCITYDILQEIAEKDIEFFHKYEDAALDSANTILNKIIMADNNDIAEARGNPTDDAKQDTAYRTLYTAMYEHLQVHYKEFNRTVMMGLITNEILGFGPLDPLWRDRKIDEIMCNGPHDIQVEIRGQFHKVPALRFRDRTHLYELIDKLFTSINKKVAPTNALVDGRLHDNSRMAVAHDVIAPDGPNFAIRRHPEEHWTPDKLIGFGAANREMLTDLGNWIHKGSSFVVIGGTSTGKTSALNALSGYFPAAERVVTLEDNIEMRLNPNKYLAAPMETKPPRPDRPDDQGITMRDLLKGTLRLSPRGIVVGEVRDGAAYDMVQSLNTGHWGCSTVHANSAEDGMYRIASLVSQSGLATYEGGLPLIAAAFDFVIVLEQYIDGTRKISNISEIAIKPELGEDREPYLPVKTLWEFQKEPNEDPKDITVRGHWQKASDLSDIRKKRRNFSIKPDLSWEQLVELSRVD